MTITWQEALTPTTAEEYVDENLAELEAAGSTINAWGPDAPQTAYVNGIARAEAALSTNISLLAATASPQTVADAGDSWVDAVLSWFAIVNADGTTGRIQATQAVWTIGLNIATTNAPVTINASNASGIQAMSANGVIFQCTQASPVTLGTPTFTGLVQFTALIAGTSGNVTPGSITRIISGPAGLTVNLVTTQTLTATARDQETNGQYIGRALGKWGVIAPSEGNPTGTAGWTINSFNFLIPFFGNNTALNASVTRWAVDDANPNGPGTVQVWLADAAGPANAATVAAVDAGLNGTNVKPVGSGPLTVAPAVAATLTINITLTTDGSNPTVATDCQTAVENLGKAFPLGPATLEPSLVTTVAQGAAVETATIATAAGKSTVIAPALAGFASVESVVIDLVAPFTLAGGEVLVLTVNVSVV